MRLVSGRGFIVVLLWVLLASIFVAIPNDDSSIILPLIAATAITGAVATFLGRRWLNTSQMSHSAFYVPLQYFWIPSLAFIIFLLVLEYMPQ